MPRKKKKSGPKVPKLPEWQLERLQLIKRLAESHNAKRPELAEDSENEES